MNNNIVSNKEILEKISPSLNSNMRASDDDKDKLPTSILESIKNIAKKDGYVNISDIRPKFISTNGGNYLGHLYTVDVKGKTSSGEKEMNIFVKVILPDFASTLINIEDVYVKEAFVYNDLFKVIAKLQDEALIPPKERFKMVKSYEESNADAIIMENLAVKGYKTLNRLEILPLKFAELAVNQMARLHGLSFVIEKKKTDYFEKRLKPMTFALKFDDEWKKFIKTSCVKAMEVLNEEQKVKFKPYADTFVHKFLEWFNDEECLRCLIHGDYRANNILMSEKNGETSDVIPVDYQIVHYGSPLYDLIYFIFPTTDRKFRQKNLIHLKDLYYTSLKKILDYFDIDVESVFPRKTFESDFKKYQYFGLMMSLQLFLFTMFDENTVPDLTNGEVSDFKYECSPIYGERVRELVDEFIEWGYL